MIVFLFRFFFIFGVGSFLCVRLSVADNIVAAERRYGLAVDVTVFIGEDVVVLVVLLCRGEAKSACDYVYFAAAFGRAYFYAREVVEEGVSARSEERRVGKECRL